MSQPDISRWATRRACARQRDNAAKRDRKRVRSDVRHILVYGDREAEQCRRLPLQEGLAPEIIALAVLHPGELYPRVGFLVTNLFRPPERVIAFYNQRGTAEQWIKIL